jgi:signal recognition particle subunit SEC65
MASEKVRLASKALGPLVRRHGTSPALKVTLRQAVKTLARALAETDTKTQAETIRQAVDELRFGLKLIQNSRRPADHAQLAGTAEALSFLAPLEGTMAPEPVRILAPAPPPASAALSPQTHPNPPPPAPAIVPRPAPAEAGDRTRPSKQQSLAFPTVRLRLVGLLNRFNALHVALTEPLATLRDLGAAEIELDKIVQAVKWLGVKCVPAFLKACENAETVEDRLVASAALIHLGALGSVEKMMSMLEGAVAEKHPLPPIAGTILRTFTDAAVLDGPQTGWRCARQPTSAARCRTGRALV